MMCSTDKHLSFSVAPRWRYDRSGNRISPYTKHKTPYSAKQATSSTHRHRIKFFPREKAAYVIMRRKGLSINQIAKFWSRSVSTVHGVLKFAVNMTVIPWADLRKSPRKPRLRAASFNGHTLEKLRGAWEAFVLGEEGEPP